MKKIRKLLTMTILYLLFSYFPYIYKKLPFIRGSCSLRLRKQLGKSIYFNNIIMYLMVLEKKKYIINTN